MKRKLKIHFSLVAIAAVLLGYACANRAQGPTGGLKDVIPPRVMHSTPVNGSLRFNKKQVQIIFDENVSIEKASENVIISPPQIKPPEVKAYGHKVTVDFNEKLIDTTTYSINFGNAIVDLNEKNPLKNYNFSFSTGSEIDTLRIAGTVINAQDLNPMSGIIVGVYVENSDSVFSKKPFLRIGKTDDKGHFSINNIKKGRYKIFALDDVSRDYYYQPGEGLALCDSMITPTFRREEMQDTIWKDTVTVDSIHKYIGTHYLPDDITLRFFKESKKRQYLVKNERKEPFVFNLFFNTALAELPVIKPLNFDWEGKYKLQKNNTLDSLTFWLTDSTVWKVDTLSMTVSYMKTDSLMQLVPTTDTINVSMRKAKINPKAKAAKKKTVTKIEPLKYTSNLAPAFDIYIPISLHFEAPLSEADISKIKLRQKVDTIFKQIPFKWQKSDSTGMNYTISNKWIAETTYDIKADSATFRSIYNKVSDKISTQFTIRSLDEYSSVKILITPYNPKAVLQVLDTKDAVLNTLPAKEKGTNFEYLKPGDYYIRMFIDENGNGKWDTGELKSHRHPEQVIYYQKKFTLKANWEFEETWDYTQVPVLEQKPQELKKDASKKKEGANNL